MAVELTKFRYSVFLLDKSVKIVIVVGLRFILLELPRSDTKRVRSCEALVRFFYCRVYFKNQSLQAHCLQATEQLSTPPVAAFLLYKNM